MAKKEKHLINWKGLLSVKGLVALGLAGILAWLIATSLNIIPDSIPVLGWVDNFIIGILLLLIGWWISGKAGDFLSKAFGGK